MKRAARSPLQARWLVPFALVVAVMAPSPLASQAPPSPADVLGYDIGEEFTDDPLFRMFWYSGLQVYANAILLGPEF